MQMSPGGRRGDMGERYLLGRSLVFRVSFFQYQVSDGTENIFVFLVLMDEPRLTLRT